MFGKVLEVMGCKKVIYGKIDGAYKYAIYVKKNPLLKHILKSINIRLAN